MEIKIVYSKIFRQEGEQFSFTELLTQMAVSLFLQSQLHRKERGYMNQVLLSYDVVIFNS